MSYFPKTLSRGQELSCELVKEIERRYNNYTSLEAALLQAQNAAIDLDKQLAALQAKLAALMLEYCPDEMTPKQMAEWGCNQKAVVVPPKEECK